MRCLSCKNKLSVSFCLVLISGVLFSFLTLPVVSAQESSSSKDRGETITFTTYYPAPFGVYQTLRLPPSEPVEQPQEGQIYYDQQEHTLKCFTNGKWSGIVWFNNAGIFLKEGAVAIAPYSIDGGRTKFKGQAKYSQGEIYTRIRIMDGSDSAVCDSEWKQGFSAKCRGRGYDVEANTSVAGVTLKVHKEKYDYIFEGQWQ